METTSDAVLQGIVCFHQKLKCTNFRKKILKNVTSLHKCDTFFLEWGIQSGIFRAYSWLYVQDLSWQAQGTISGAGNPSQVACMQSKDPVPWTLAYNAQS